MWVSIVDLSGGATQEISRLFFEDEEHPVYDDMNL